MKRLKVVRISEHAGATFGVLLCDGRPIALTLEDAWRDNARQVSCIPEGRYAIQRHNSPKFGEVFLVAKVPNRSHILIHAGNTHHDTHGCILLGLRYGAVGSEWGVLQSREAMQVFMQSLAGHNAASLEISSVSV